MMNPAPPEGALEEVITSNRTDLDKNRKLPSESTWEKLRGRLRARIFVDLSIIVVVGILVCFVEFGVIPNTQKGFTCKDPSISYPFVGDTVSVTALLISAYFGPILIILLVEYFRENYSLKKLCIGTVWNYYKDCLIGATFVLLITEIIKVLMGEPRPHFIDSCEPDANDNCTKGTFVFDYKCRNTRVSTFFMTDITRSFPSGHTSVSFFMALYCSYLVQVRIPTDVVSSLTKPFLIAVCLTWSLFCSLSRITDHRHHWWDVLGGAFLGICGAFYSLSLLHRKEKQQKNKNRMSRTDTSMTMLSEEKTKEVGSGYI